MRPALKQSVHTWAGHADRPLTVQVSVLSVCKTLSLIPRLGEARGGCKFLFYSLSRLSLLFLLYLFLQVINICVLSCAFYFKLILFSKIVSLVGLAR